MVVKYQEHAEEFLLAKDVDTFWHTHLLQTRRYAADCENVFGTFLHHDPHPGERTAADLDKRVALVQRTRALYEREFGDAAVAAWSGSGASQAQAAYCTVASRQQAWAFPGTAVNDANKASLGLDIEALNAAYCFVSVRVEDAALSPVGITADRAAYSTVADV